MNQTTVYNGTQIASESLNEIFNRAYHNFPRLPKANEKAHREPEIKTQIMSECGVTISAEGYIDHDRDLETRTHIIEATATGINLTVYGVPIELSKTQQQLIIKAYDGHCESCLQEEYEDNL